MGRYPKLKIHGKRGMPSGFRGTKEYATWHEMFRRCYAKDRPFYHRYGGRGISVCKRWRDFTLFFADMGAAPSKKHSLDRIDNDGNYTPKNCRWATIDEQSANRCTNKYYEYAGIKGTIGEICEKLGKPYEMTRLRMKRGWDIVRAIEETKHWRGV